MNKTVALRSRDPKQRPLAQADGAAEHLQAPRSEVIAAGSGEGSVSALPRGELTVQSERSVWLDSMQASAVVSTAVNIFPAGSASGAEAGAFVPAAGRKGGGESHGTVLVAGGVRCTVVALAAWKRLQTCRLLVAACGLLGVVSLSGAAEPMTLRQAFSMVLEGHPVVDMRRGGVDAAQEDVNAAKWKRFPTVTAENSQFIGNQSVVLTNQSGHSATWRVQQPLWTGGKISAEIDGAGMRKHVAEWSLVEAEQELLTRVAQSFNDFVRLQQRVQIATENLGEHQRLFEQIRRRTDQQVSSEADVALAQARLQQAQTELATLRSLYSNAGSTLEQLVGMPIEQPVRAETQRLETLPVVTAVLDAAKGYSPTLKRLEQEREVARNEVDSRRALLYPNVSLRYEKFTGAATAIPLDRYMVTLEYQPGAGLSSVSAINAAAKRAEMATSALEAGRRDITEKTLNQYSETRSFAEQSEPARAYARAASDVMASYLRQYTTGRKSWLDVMNAQREQTQARNAAVDVEVGALLSLIKLDILTGRLTRVSVLTPPKP